MASHTCPADKGHLKTSALQSIMFCMWVSHDCHVISCPRHEDLKLMLDGSKDGQKLDAMKLTIGVGYKSYYDRQLIGLKVVIRHTSHHWGMPCDIQCLQIRAHPLHCFILGACDCLFDLWPYCLQCYLSWNHWHFQFQSEYFRDWSKVGESSSCTVVYIIVVQSQL